MIALNEMMASEHWPYIWPCYVLAVGVFVALAVRAVVKLDYWKRRSGDDS